VGVGFQDDVFSLGFPKNAQRALSKRCDFSVKTYTEQDNEDESAILNGLQMITTHFHFALKVSRKRTATYAIHALKQSTQIPQSQQDHAW